MSYSLKQELLFHGTCTILASALPGIPPDKIKDRIKQALVLAEGILNQVEDYTKEKI